jgi:hypothetical protein
MTAEFGLGIESEGSLLLCPKCGWPNPLAAEVCAQCERHLFVACHHCGHLNCRGNVRCVACRTQLRYRTGLGLPRVDLQVWPAKWRLSRSRKWLLPTEVGVFIAGVLLTAVLAIKMAEWISPLPAQEGPPVYVIENGRLKAVELP